MIKIIIKITDDEEEEKKEKSRPWDPVFGCD